MNHPLSRRIADVLTLDPAAGAIESDGQWISWGTLAESARRAGDLVSQGDEVGLLLHNRPAQVAALLGVLLNGGCAAVINPARGDDRIKADIDDLQLPLIIADPRLGGEPVVTRNDTVGAARRPGVAVRMLTSGTTGPPKRIDLTYDMLARSVMGGDEPAGPVKLRRGVAIVNAPLVHIGGVFRVLRCVTEGRSFVLLDRFDLDRWADAVRRHRPGAVSLVPAALRTVLHSDLTRDDLSSIRAVTSGTAPLSADDADAFTERYGIPVLTSYAATEFGGGVAAWTLADHQKYWHTKRGSVGRATLGAQLRVVDDDGTPQGPDEVGLLEVIPGQLGPSADWMRTTDVGRIDSDGFLWILGRADQAIIRGGFKIMPDDVRTVLENHPAVQGAAIVGRPDDRLGEIPVAMVELRDGAVADAGELAEFVGTRMARYEVPAQIAIVDAIPRTPSGKPDLRAVTDFFCHA